MLQWHNRWKVCTDRACYVYEDVNRRLARGRHHVLLAWEGGRGNGVGKKAGPLIFQVSKANCREWC
jgi:hypothetical protein